MSERGHFLVAQISDIHCGSARYVDEMLLNVIERVNAQEPDVVIVAGDLTADGYPNEYELARERLSRLECDNIAVVIGNHDARNVGYVLFEQIFGERYQTWHFDAAVPMADGTPDPLTVVGIDSSKPDLDDGELGRHRHHWLEDRLQEAPGFKLVVLHHHLITIPGTGRERNIVWDAGEVLEILTRNHVELVLAGHKHVPYVWPIGPTLIVTTGTASTYRTRGMAGPSFGLVDITEDYIGVAVCESDGDGVYRTQYPRPKTHLEGEQLEREREPAHTPAVGAHV